MTGRLDFKRWSNYNAMYKKLPLNTKYRQVLGKKLRIYNIIFNQRKAGIALLILDK